MTEQKPDSVVRCEFAEPAGGWVKLGRKCRLDTLLCFLFDKPELVEKCPALRSRQE